ncbi:MAG: cobaltochelatase subunit CobN [Chloroflexi bacterium]|nr:cobaltochelatase subunit CobN [Chloroflexota bacterium]
MIVFLSTADTDLLTLSSLELRDVLAANPTVLTSSALQEFASRAETAVVLRLLGGRRTLEAEFDGIREWCLASGVPLVAVPGDAVPDAELAALSTAPAEVVQRTHQYLVAGGAENLESMVRCLRGETRPAPVEQPWNGTYERVHPHPSRLPEGEGASTVAVLFYRAHQLSGNTGFVEALCEALEREGCRARPIFVYSLKADSAQDIEPLLQGVDAIVNTLSFSSGAVEWLKRLDVPVLQALVSTSSRQDWARRSGGLSPVDAAMNVALPEFDGSIITVPVCFKEAIASDERIGTPLVRYVADPERVAMVARLARNWARLRHTLNKDRRVAFILSNYPTKNARIGNAVGLDTPASLLAVLRAMRGAGYTIGELPQTSDELMFRLIERCSNDRDSLTEQQLRDAVGHVSPSQYQQWFDGWPEEARRELGGAWGEPPGTVFATNKGLAIAGLTFGNVFVGIQPPRGFGENPIAIYHAPDLPPTHHYLAYYGWLREVFHADAIVHVGKHGTLEWLPGKALGLSASCYPDLSMADVPHFYPFIINNPGEGAQAKRRAHACILDHLIPAMTTAESYNELVRIEQLMDEYYQVQTLDPSKTGLIRDQIWEAVTDAQLHRDLGESEPPSDFDAFLLHIDGYLCELKDSQIRDGLHVLGSPPEGEQLADLLLALTRLDNVDMPSLRRTTCEELGLDLSRLLEERGALYGGPQLDGVRSNGDAIDFVERLNRQKVKSFLSPHPSPAPEGEGVRALKAVLDQTGDEITNLLRGLEGRFVPPGPSGAPTRGMAHVLPTGRNFYSVDPKSLPSPAAWEVGQQLGKALLDKYLREEGRYPESVGMVVWGTSAMRTQGDDIAEILWLLGVRPVWMRENRRVTGIELIPLEELRRPRIDVTVRISGFFRDAFPNLIDLMDDALRLVAHAEEGSDQNLVAAHFRRDGGTDEALYRIFGSKPGSYGAGILPLLDARNWSTDQDLAEVYTAWGGFAYTRREYGREAKQAFGRRFKEIAIATKNQDNREHDIFDSDDYLQYHGGMIATVRALTGRNPRQFFGDSANPALIRVRDLDDEARRVFRSRVINPKWIESVKRHGYKGAFELAATIDYLYGYDATAGIVEDWMYERATQAYVQESGMEDFFAASNPWALKDIAERLLEAIERGMWKNPSEEQTAALRQAYLRMHLAIEARGEAAS